MGAVMKELLGDLARRHPSVGAVRSIGLFGLVELVRDKAKKTPLAPFNGTSDEMAALGKFFRQEGLYTFVRWNTFFTNPPLCITEAELREAFAIIDRGLEITDRAVKKQLRPSPRGVKRLVSVLVSLLALALPDAGRLPRLQRHPVCARCRAWRRAPDDAGAVPPAYSALFMETWRPSSGTTFRLHARRGSAS